LTSTLNTVTRPYIEGTAGIKKEFWLDGHQFLEGYEKKDAIAHPLNENALSYEISIAL
jgi:hypothetical protein